MFNDIYDLFTETLIEAEEKVLAAQYTTDISDYGSSKKRKSKDGAVETISLIPETLPSFMNFKKSKIIPGNNANTKDGAIETITLTPETLMLYKMRRYGDKVWSTQDSDLTNCNMYNAGW
ncbi:uncharacterized protein LOC107884334 [Acyrthosiphon pisum]|uniref:Uncharacterized protein n=1 Tax=Acyrthosiphon pisum TaxID=7029 RepID=A0A8R2H9X8_ACYPI|nr:uncharacterized protein LOC107884334 [Acyrthosiphon pisum]|eukprot:XP_016661653.1 PREDICTED: uncharacterized protein LOC107884334 isoform X2 [Acyrthosiphon pisum]